VLAKTNNKVIEYSNSR